MRANENGIIWLASYPKSGNTWTRLVLNQLHHDNQFPPNLNHLNYAPIASTRELVEEALGLDISELSHSEIDKLRPMAHQQIAKSVVAPHAIKIHKIHDAYSDASGDAPLIPAGVSRGAIIIVRNPLDIAVSYANHANISLEESTQRLCDSHYALAKSEAKYTLQLRQKLGSWSDHVSSWLNATIPKLVIRYEDLSRYSVLYFSEICDFLELGKTPEEVRQAIEACQFDKMKTLEIENGFRERAPKTKAFFRKGTVGDWQEQLSKNQIEQIINANKNTMQRLGYLDQIGNVQLHPSKIQFTKMSGSAHE